MPHSLLGWRGLNGIVQGCRGGGTRSSPAQNEGLRGEPATCIIPGNRPTPAASRPAKCRCRPVAGPFIDGRQRPAPGGAAPAPDHTHQFDHSAGGGAGAGRPRPAWPSRHTPARTPLASGLSVDYSADLNYYGEPLNYGESLNLSRQARLN
ncbi:hypothetical protein GCM10023320_23820 [Pseudonocardia adelaidensis]|uniref:Uncharacterized protein n=1 Tax=Pseudonocardia adelaidensis TaxID=648754 RepID=A0ABP9NIJ3_9PSEU